MLSTRENFFNIASFLLCDSISENQMDYCGFCFTDQKIKMKIDYKKNCSVFVPLILMNLLIHEADVNDGWALDIWKILRIPKK